MKRTQADIMRGKTVSAQRKMLSWQHQSQFAKNFSRWTQVANERYGNQYTCTPSLSMKRRIRATLAHLWVPLGLRWCPPCRNPCWPTLTAVWE